MLAARRAIMGYTGETVFWARRPAHQTKRVVNVRCADGVGKATGSQYFRLAFISDRTLVFKPFLTVEQVTNTVPAFGMTTVCSTPTDAISEVIPIKLFSHSPNPVQANFSDHLFWKKKQHRLTSYFKTVKPFIKAKLFGCSHPHIYTLAERWMLEDEPVWHFSPSHREKYKKKFFFKPYIKLLIHFHKRFERNQGFISPSSQG